MDPYRSKWTQPVQWLLALLMIPLHFHNCVACMFPWVHHRSTYEKCAAALGKLRRIF